MMPEAVPDAVNERLEEAEGASAAKQDAPETRGPMEIEDAGRNRKLTFEQAVAHIGGEANLVSEHGQRLIRNNAHQYLWKYRDKVTHCTACGGSIDGFYGNHGDYYACPICGARCEFRYEAKGHAKCYDEFYLYEWRRSVLDGETIVLTGADVWRNSCRTNSPHEAPLHIDPSAIYVFRPGKAVTVYKQRRYWDNKHQWEQKKEVHPEHTSWGTKALDVVMDQAEFRRAIEGTRIGRLFEMLREESGRWDTLELQAIANCARRPWLEYLYKSGQRYLAGRLLRETRISKDIVPNMRAKKPRDLLGLTEAQWFETRRDELSLTPEALKTLHAMTMLDIGPVKVAEAMKLAARTDAAWRIKSSLLNDRGRYGSPSVCDRLRLLPDKPRRKILRRILSDITHTGDWRDYYNQLARLGEVPTEGDAFAADADMALLLPKDMARMHQRMTDRENAIAAEKRARELESKQTELEKRLVKLRKVYTFAACGLVLRPFESMAEVVTEGQRLHICIGSYAERYASGGTIICCLRRADAPEVSWRAVEFSAKTGKLVQDHGAYNDGHGGIPPEDRELLSRFWAAWNKEHEKVRASA